MNFSTLHVQTKTPLIFDPLALSYLAKIPAPSETRSLGFQYIINSTNPIIEILHSPLPDKLSPKTQDPNEAIQSARGIDDFFLAINKIDWGKDQIDLEKLLEKLDKFKQDEFKYYKCAKKIYSQIADLIKKNKVFNLSIMNLTLDLLKDFCSQNNELKEIIDSMNSKLKEATNIKLQQLTPCFKKLKTIDPLLTKDLISSLYNSICNLNKKPNTRGCLEILEGLEYNNSSEVKPILKFILNILKGTNVIDRKGIGLVLNFLREKDPELYADFITSKLNMILDSDSNNSQEEIVLYLSLPSAETNNKVIEAYINKLENFQSSNDFNISKSCRLIKYCRNKNQDHANRILLALDKILKNKQDKITEEDKQIFLRELNLLKFVNPHTKGLEVINNLKNQYSVEQNQSSLRNQMEQRCDQLLKELRIRVLRTRYIDGIEMDFLIMIGSGLDTKKINLEIDGKYHNKFNKLKENELRDKYLASQGVEVIRLKLPNGYLDNTALKELICEKLGIN